MVPDNECLSTVEVLRGLSRQLLIFNRHESKGCRELATSSLKLGEGVEAGLLRWTYA